MEDSSSWALTKVCSYFAILIGSLILVVAKLPLWKLRKSVVRQLAHCVLALVAVTVTWRYILEFTQDSLTEHGDLDTWLEKSDVFTAAYISVTNTAIGWFWSSQLLTWTCIGCVFLQIESGRHGINHAWAFALVGFLGAISLGFPLFFSYLKGTVIENGRQRQSKFLLFCVVLTMAGIVVLPATSGKAYEVILLAIHFLLAVPFFRSTKGTSESMHSATLICATYAFLSGIAFTLHLTNVMRVIAENWGPDSTVSGLLDVILSGGFTHSCQISISFDVVFITVASMLFVVGEGSWMGGFLMMLSPVLSVGCSFGLSLLVYELRAAKKAAASVSAKLD
eukprot:Colp12_sorted_trinity150504_noHs@35864